MTTIARRIAATPVRTASSTWDVIADLLGAAGGDIRSRLSEAAGVASMLIAEEHTAGNPIILSGCGPQVRVYTLHGTDAIDGSQLNEQALTVVASDGWTLTLPASGPDFDLASAALDGVAKIDVYNPGDTNGRQLTTSRLPSGPTVTVDLTALEN